MLPNNQYPFGMVIPGRTFSSDNYRFGLNGQEKDNEVSGTGNSYTAEYWHYDSRSGRRWNLDPVVKHDQSGYNAFANNPIWYIDLNGKDTVVIFDKAINPDDKRVYTATLYIVKAGEVLGPYIGSSYPNDDSKQNTLEEGWHNYNNEWGHKGGTEKGLNLVDDANNRFAPGISPSGEQVQMEYVNIHSGVSPEDDPGKLNRQNRGSAGCPTVSPADAQKFFGNFNWTNSAKTTGDNTGQLGVFRGSSENGDKFKSMLEIRQILQKGVTNGAVVKLNSTSNALQW